MSIFPPDDVEALVQQDVPPVLDTPIVDDHQPQGSFWGYNIEEDNALKQKLSGITVATLNRRDEPVRVWFGNPEKEERSVRYPFITIEGMGETVASEREHRGWVKVPYMYLQNTSLTLTAGQGPPMMEYPLPMNLEYVVTTHARNNQHHAQLISILTGGDYLHPRFAYLTCSAGTMRRIEVLSRVPAIGIDSDAKRIFRMVYRLRVPTEVEAAVVAGTQVQKVTTTLVDTVSSQSTQFSYPH
jgi:hypothetical protein